MDYSNISQRQNSLLLHITDYQNYNTTNFYRMLVKQLSPTTVLQQKGLIFTVVL